MRGFERAPQPPGSRASASEALRQDDSADALRVLHVIPSLGGGGAERQVSYIAAEQVKHGCTVHLAYLHDGPNRAALEGSGVNVTRIPCTGNHDPMILWRLWRLVARTRPHLIQTWVPQMDILGGLAALLTRTPFVLSERASELCYGNGWKDRLRRRIGAKARAIVANSATGCEYWRDVQDGARCSVIRNGIPFGALQKTLPLDDRSLGVARDEELIVFAGRYAPQKNVLNMLTAIDGALAKRPRAVARLYGQGPLKAQMLEMKARLAAGARIEILEYTNELWRIVKRARVFVSVSTFEGHPNTVLEAVALGCPVVISDIPEHREFLDERSAYFAPPQSPAAIEERILAALTDPGGAAEKARAAQALVTQWTVESATRQYVELYRTSVATAVR